MTRDPTPSAPPPSERSARSFWIGLARDWGLALLVAVVIFVGWSLFIGTGSLVSSGEAPDFTLETLDGETVTLTDLRGEPVVVNFWATWCGPCKAEMPDLEAWSKANPGVPLLGISTDRGMAPGRLRRFVEQYGLSYPILHDSSGAVADTWGVDTLPTTIVVSADGHIGASHVGRIRRSGLDALVAEATEHGH